MFLWPATVHSARLVRNLTSPLHWNWLVRPARFLTLRLGVPDFNDSQRERSRVALVHDFLLDMRGGERVFTRLCDIWPHADIFTAVYDEAGTEGRFTSRRVHTSFLQHLR